MADEKIAPGIVLEEDLARILRVEEDILHQHGSLSVRDADERLRIRDVGERRLGRAEIHLRAHAVDAAQFAADDERVREMVDPAGLEEHGRGPGVEGALNRGGVVGFAGTPGADDGDVVRAGALRAPRGCGRLRKARRHLPEEREAIRRGGVREDAPRFAHVALEFAVDERRDAFHAGDVEGDRRAQAAALTGVADGRTGIVELLMAQKNLREAHTAATAARLDQIQALADLVKPQIEACYVSARADGGYSTNLRLVDLIDSSLARLIEGGGCEDQDRGVDCQGKCQRKTGVPSCQPKRFTAIY